MKVAKSKSLTYSRNLPLLQQLAMEVDNYDLTIELVKEILSHKLYREDIVALSTALDTLHCIASDFLSDDPIDMDILQRTLTTFNIFALSESDVTRQSIILSDEIFRVQPFYFFSANKSVDEGDGCISSNSDNDQDEDHTNTGDINRKIDT